MRPRNDPYITALTYPGQGGELSYRGVAVVDTPKAAIAAPVSTPLKAPERQAPECSRGMGIGLSPVFWVTVWVTVSTLYHTGISILSLLARFLMTYCHYPRLPL